MVYASAWESLNLGEVVDGVPEDLDTETLLRVRLPAAAVALLPASPVRMVGPVIERLGVVAKFGCAKVSLPGGCAIGARPINLHLMGLEKMGAEVKLESGYVIARAKRLRGAAIYFDIPTVTGTENLMMAATLARGTTILENAAREPEVADFAQALISMGARIKGAGESIIEIEGVDEMRPMNYSIIPDRIEAGTFMTIAGITGSDITLKECRIEHLDALIMKLGEAGLLLVIHAEQYE